MMCVPFLPAFFLACSLAPCPWRIASQKQKLLLASQQFVFLLLLPSSSQSAPPPLLFVFLGCRHLVTRGRNGVLVPTFALIFGPLARKRSWMAFPSLPSLQVHSLLSSTPLAPHDICRIQSADLSSEDGEDDGGDGGGGGVYLDGRQETSFNDPWSQTIAVEREIRLAASKVYSSFICAKS